MSVSRVGERARKLQSVFQLRVGDGAAILPESFYGLHFEFAAKPTDGHQGPRMFWRHYLRRLKYHNPAIPMIVNRTQDQQGPATLSIYMREQPKKETLSLPSPDANASAEAKTSPQAGEQGTDLVVSSSKPKPAAGGSAETGVRKVPDEKDPWITIHSHSQGGSPAPDPRVGETRVQIDAKWLSPEGLWNEFVKQSGAQPIEPSEQERAELSRIIRGRLEKARVARVDARRKAIEGEAKARMDAAIAEAAALKQG